MIRIGSSINITNLKFGRSFPGGDVTISPNTGFKIKSCSLSNQFMAPEKLKYQKHYLREGVWPREIDVGRACILFWELRTRDNVTIYMLTPRSETLIIQYMIPKAVQFLKKLCWLRAGCNVEICRLLVKSYDCRHDILLCERLDRTLIVESLTDSNPMLFHNLSFSSYVEDEKRRIRALESGKTFFNRASSFRIIQSCERRFIQKVTVSFIAEISDKESHPHDMIYVLRTAYDAMIVIAESNLFTLPLKCILSEIQEKAHNDDESLVMDVLTCIEWIDEIHAKSIIPPSVFRHFVSNRHSHQDTDGRISCSVNEIQESNQLALTSMVSIHRILACFQGSPQED